MARWAPDVEDLSTPAPAPVALSRLAGGKEAASKNGSARGAAPSPSVSVEELALQASAAAAARDYAKSAALDQQLMKRLAEVQSPGDVNPTDQSAWLSVRAGGSRRGSRRRAPHGCADPAKDRKAEDRGRPVDGDGKKDRRTGIRAGDTRSADRGWTERGVAADCWPAAKSRRRNRSGHFPPGIGFGGVWLGGRGITSGGRELARSSDPNLVIGSGATDGNAPGAGRTPAIGGHTAHEADLPLPRRDRWPLRPLKTSALQPIEQRAKRARTPRMPWRGWIAIFRRFRARARIALPPAWRRFAPRRRRHMTW